MAQIERGRRLQMASIFTILLLPLRRKESSKRWGNWRKSGNSVSV
jgi:hypothetical protein